MRRDIQNVDDDIACKKRIIERKLYEDPDIIEILDDPDIDPDCPEEIIYSSIYHCIRIPGTQDVSKNFITFSIDDTERMPYNQVMKTQIVQFVIFVHKDHIKTKYGIARHDLLGFIVRDLFHLSNCLGAQMEIISNKEYVTDTDYMTRTLKFELITDNSTKPLRTNPYEYDRIIGHRG